MLTKEEKNDFKKYLLSLKEDIRERIKDDEGLNMMYEEINKALEKFDNNTYGICEMCKEDIHIIRLEVRPYTPHCITCREISEKSCG